MPHRLLFKFLIVSPALQQGFNRSIVEGLLLQANDFPPPERHQHRLPGLALWKLQHLRHWFQPLDMRLLSNNPTWWKGHGLVWGNQRQIGPFLRIISTAFLHLLHSCIKVGSNLFSIAKSRKICQQGKIRRRGYQACNEDVQCRWRFHLH